MYTRELGVFLKEMAEKYPILTMIGPRQSGKSTLARVLFPNHQYLSLEEPDTRQQALQDPRAFFSHHSGDLIIDEVQRAPELLSYLQSLVDQPKNRRHFLLTGSQQLLLMEKVSQSLAGRTFIAKLLPFTRSELLQYPQSAPQSLEASLFYGGYPRIFDKQLPPQQWLEQYYQTYVERDVRQLIRVGEVDLFDRFTRLCAGRVGQLINFSSLANDCGISAPTASSWLSALKTSFICFSLAPHFRNFSKRLVKSPKLYFYDTGLLCYLLRIKSPQDLTSHSLRGHIFENWVISEAIKSQWNMGQEPNFYFWRDSNGHEVDLLRDEGKFLYPIEIKSAMTFHPDFIKTLVHLNDLQGKKFTGIPLGTCVYGGEESFDFKNYRIQSWKDVS